MHHLGVSEPGSGLEKVEGPETHPQPLILTLGLTSSRQGIRES
jgi:hypothetical protein